MMGGRRHRMVVQVSQSDYLGIRMISPTSAPFPNIAASWFPVDATRHAGRRLTLLGSAPVEFVRGALPRPCARTCPQTIVNRLGGSFERVNRRKLPEILACSNTKTESAIWTSGV